MAYFRNPGERPQIRQETASSMNRATGNLTDDHWVYQGFVGIRQVLKPGDRSVYVVNPQGSIH